MALCLSDDRHHPVSTCGPLPGTYRPCRIPSCLRLDDRLPLGNVELYDNTIKTKNREEHSDADWSEMRWADRLGTRAGCHCIAEQRGGAKKADLWLRSAEDHGIWVRWGSIRKTSRRAERRQTQGRPISRRAARPGASDAAEAAVGRHRFHHHLHGQRLDRGSAGRRLLATLHLPGRGSPRQGRRRPRCRERVQSDDR